MSCPDPDGGPPEAGAAAAEAAPGTPRPSPLDLAATPARLRALAAAGLLDERALAAGLAAIGRRPTPSSWRRFALGHLLLLGAALLAAGAVFFIAANWDAVPPHARMGLVAAGVVCSAGLGAWLGLETLGGRAAVLLGALLIGPLLAVYGQTYQTGADAYELFLGWTLFAAGFAAVARFQWLWILEIGLLDTAMCLWWVQEAGRTIEPEEALPLYLGLLALQAALVAAWEWESARGIAWMRGRAFPRVGATAGTAAALIPVLAWIAGEMGSAPPLLLAAALAGAAAALSVLAVVYRTRIPDLFMLALAGAAAATVLSTAAGRLFFEEMDLEAGGFFLLGFLILGEMTALAIWLRAWRAHPAHRGTRED